MLIRDYSWMRRLWTGLLIVLLAGGVAVGFSACAPAQSEWVPTESDPVLFDEEGRAWGIYYPGPEAKMTRPDMQYIEGDNGVFGYLDTAAYDAAEQDLLENLPVEPGRHKIPITLSLYALFSDEVVDAWTTEHTVINAGGSEGDTAGEPEGTSPSENANAWYPKQVDDVPVTSDGRVWGMDLVEDAPDMAYVMADNGAWGFISNAAREDAQVQNWKNAQAMGSGEYTVMLDVVLYDTDTVVGQYSVTLHA